MQREGVYEGAVHPAHRGAVQVTDTSARSRRALLGAPLAGPPDLRGSQGPGARGGPRGCTARAGPAGGRRRRQPGQRRCAGPRLRQGAAPGRAGLCRAVQSCAKPCRAGPSRAGPCRAGRGGRDRRRLLPAPCSCCCRLRLAPAAPPALFVLWAAEHRAGTPVNSPPLMGNSRELHRICHFLTGNMKRG